MERIQSENCMGEQELQLDFVISTSKRLRLRLKRDSEMFSVRIKQSAPRT